MSRNLRPQSGFVARPCSVAGGAVGCLELEKSEGARVVSVKRLSHDRARLDTTLHYPEG
ncbi:hypothetical protein [Yinghuangia sp. YIM S09857]|uniref:hypothetical protein n=1 Tax=Yinghuangia sp. YIM S09857 TaxID=3436929 RepID=UPI003F539F50